MKMIGALSLIAVQRNGKETLLLLAIQIALFPIKRSAHDTWKWLESGFWVMAMEQRPCLLHLYTIRNKAFDLWYMKMIGYQRLLDAIYILNCWQLSASFMIHENDGSPARNFSKLSAYCIIYENYWSPTLHKQLSNGTKRDVATSNGLKISS